MWVYSPPARVGRRGRLRHAVPHPGRHDRRLPQWRADAEIRTAPLLNFTIGIDGETVGVEGQGPGAIGSFIALTQTIAKAFGWGDTGSPIEDVEIFNEPAGTGSGLGGPEPDRCRTRRSRAGEALADLHEASGPGPEEGREDERPAEGKRHQRRHGPHRDGARPRLAVLTTDVGDGTAC